MAGQTAHEHLLRELAPQVLAAVIRRFGDFGVAEDAVQEALLAASLQWPREGVPDNARAWLTHVAARRATDQVRAESARRRREQLVAEQVGEELEVGRTEVGDGMEDDTLMLFFMCCHPAITRPSAIALTLRAVGGLTTSEIAAAFMVPEATMAQRISRAKQSIKKSGVGFCMPHAPERVERLETVLHVLYLIFNEGYASTSGAELQRVDLCRESIRLTRAIHRVTSSDPEVAGLLALMLLTDARRAARSGPDGELIPLDEQDRALWDREAIAEGVELVSAAIKQRAIGSYQLQAAIAAVHDQAPSVDQTDWAEILGLYSLLMQLSDNPMVRLNQAIALAMVHGPAAGLGRLAALEADPRLKDHHRLLAVRGHLHERAGDQLAATRDYRDAAARTANLAERNYLLLKAARLKGAEATS